MSIKKFPLEAYGAAVSREELVQAALDEITKNYREASLSNVARSYGVSLAYVSECVRAQTGRTYKELLQKHRMETAARLLRRSDWNIQQITASQSMRRARPGPIPSQAAKGRLSRWKKSRVPARPEKCERYRVECFVEHPL